LIASEFNYVKVKRDQGNKYKFRISKNAVSTEKRKKENNNIQTNKINKTSETPDKIQKGHEEKINKAHPP
jgi:hypothetical protein